MHEWMWQSVLAPHRRTPRHSPERGATARTAPLPPSQTAAARTADCLAYTSIGEILEIYGHNTEHTTRHSQAELAAHRLPTPRQQARQDSLRKRSDRVDGPERAAIRKPGCWYR